MKALLIPALIIATSTGISASATVQEIQDHAKSILAPFQAIANNIKANLQAKQIIALPAIPATGLDINVVEAWVLSRMNIGKKRIVNRTVVPINVTFKTYLSEITMPIIGLIGLDFYYKLKEKDARTIEKETAAIIWSKPPFNLPLTGYGSGQGVESVKVKFTNNADGPEISPMDLLEHSGYLFLGKLGFFKINYYWAADKL